MSGEGTVYKGASLVSVRQMLQLASLEERLLEGLDDADRDRYRRVTASDWVPIELAERVYAQAAPLLHPGHPGQPGQAGQVRLLGRDLARDHLRGIYRFVVRLATVQFVADQTGRLWRMYNGKGALVVERLPGQAIRMVLTDYPEYPEVVRESLAGYIGGAIELTGAQQVRVAVNDEDRMRYTFTTTWR